MGCLRLSPSQLHFSKLQSDRSYAEGPVLSSINLDQSVRHHEGAVQVAGVSDVREHDSESGFNYMVEAGSIFSTRVDPSPLPGTEMSLRAVVASYL